jgi:pSer/pThr/pTyr-binding forkhead associated (FHA) protein
MRFELHVMDGADAGKQFSFEDHSIVIGHSIRADCILNDRTVSKNHAEIRKMDQHYVLTDLGSKNGTLVNGKSIQTLALKNRDMITLGRTTLQFVHTSPPGEKNLGSATISKDTIEIKKEKVSTITSSKKKPKAKKKGSQESSPVRIILLSLVLVAGILFLLMVPAKEDDNGNDQASVDPTPQPLRELPSIFDLLAGVDQEPEPESPEAKADFSAEAAFNAGERVWPQIAQGQMTYLEFVKKDHHRNYLKVLAHFYHQKPENRDFYTTAENRISAVTQGLQDEFFPNYRSLYMAIQDENWDDAEERLKEARDFLAVIRRQFDISEESNRESQRILEWEPIIEKGLQKTRR